MPQPTLPQLGAAIRSLRNQRELSIEALAGETDLHTVSVSRIERGKQNLTWLNLSAFAEVLNVEIIDLVQLAIKQPISEAAAPPDPSER